MNNMNYYNPNFYQNYPYNNGYTNNQYTPQYQPQTLNGKVVDTIDMVKATEVPLGGYGVFPKADLSEIYIKTWNQNGTTGIATFRPVDVEEPQKPIELKELLNRIIILEEKIDSIINNQPQKKEIVTNDAKQF